MKRALERDDAGPAGRAAGVLERRLDRLGARVAEERLRTAEAVARGVARGSASAPSSRGSRRARAGELAPARRRAGPGWQCPRPDDRDSAERGRGSACRPRRRPSTRRPHERHVLARVGREHRRGPSRPRSRHHRRRADLGLHAEPGGGHGSPQLRHDPAFEALVEERLASAAPITWRPRRRRRTGRDVGQEEDPLGASPTRHGEGRRRLVGVDVQRAAGERRRRPG